jgi:hypothetical protein
MTRIWKRHRRTAEEAAIDEALKKEREELDLEAFLPSYARATGFVLTIEEAAEDPDFIMKRSDGLTVGIELTAIREQGPPDTPLFREITTGTREGDRDDALDDMWRMIAQKSDKIESYRTQYNILVLQNVETNFALLCDGAMQIPVTDFASAGFREIWVAATSVNQPSTKRPIFSFDQVSQSARFYLFGRTYVRYADLSGVLFRHNNHGRLCAGRKRNHERV